MKPLLVKSLCPISGCIVLMTVLFADTMGKLGKILATIGLCILGILFLVSCWNIYALRHLRRTRQQHNAVDDIEVSIDEIVSNSEITHLNVLIDRLYSLDKELCQDVKTTDQTCRICYMYRSNTVMNCSGVHCICSSCLDEILIRGSTKCPFCNTVISSIS